MWRPRVQPAIACRGSRALDCVARHVNEHIYPRGWAAGERRVWPGDGVVVWGRQMITNAGRSPGRPAASWKGVMSRASVAAMSYWSYPFASGRGASRRLALIVPNDRDNRRLDNTMIAQIATNVRRAYEPPQLLVERSTLEGQQAGLLHDSVVSCNILATVHDDRIDRVIGHFPDALMHRIDECLNTPLGLL